jgi:hypothetical protein
VLRGRPIAAGAVSEAAVVQDVAWLHDFLAPLAGLGFPWPRPLPAFGGQSWTLAEGLVWEIVSFIPGHEVGWDAEPPMDQIGALLARYHATARRIQVTSQRPGVIPLAEVPAILLSRQLDVACPSPDRAAVIRRLAARLAAGLEDCGHRTAARLVIHGARQRVHVSCRAHINRYGVVHGSHERRIMSPARQQPQPGALNWADKGGGDHAQADLGTYLA